MLVLSTLLWSLSTWVRLGGGAGGELEPDEFVPAVAGLYMVLELLSLFCSALNLFGPVRPSISSNDISSSSGGSLGGGGGVADILCVLLCGGGGAVCKF